MQQSPVTMASHLETLRGIYRTFFALLHGSFGHGGDEQKENWARTGADSLALLLLRTPDGGQHSVDISEHWRW